jgi:hypothetical protein
MSANLHCGETDITSSMRYKVTSRTDITILASVPSRAGGTGKVKDSKTEALIWVPVLANQPADGLGTVIGVDPRCVRGTHVVTEGNFTYVPIEPGADGLKEHFGLFKIEPSSVPD